MQCTITKAILLQARSSPWCETAPIKSSSRHAATPTGRFSTRISPGRYGIRAIAEGFNAVVFSAVEVRASQELVYRFNLEPIGAGKTLPERRKDREDVKWTLRSSHTRRSIFQAQEGEDRDIQAVLGQEPTPDEEKITIAATDDSFEASRKDSQRRMRGVVETYFANNSYGASYSALNFALSASPSDGFEVIFAGQTGVGPNAPERFEASSHFRVGEQHRVGLGVGTIRAGEALLVTSGGWSTRPDWSVFSSRDRRVDCARWDSCRARSRLLPIHWRRGSELF